ncbi:porin [Acinetobacter sp. LoGeW2-3]|uniref:porin n=1 Tax=Acinetobacter sp. LoGeW2-3 TaxID=1808001 RepID=UPI000C05C1CF|nr:porin [Acinetobacter sp. LoGeW2-3]ATO20534.1 porin [Acinetobacter sp. LoGeW2-3]
MKKTAIALTIGASILTPMIASAADVKLYGRAHVSLDYLDDGQDYQEVGLSSNSSRLGFKVEQKINDDLNVFAQIEQEISFASGDQDSKAINFSTRDTFVGLKNDQYGQLRVGRFDSPFKTTRSPVNQFGDMIGDIRNVTRVGDLKFDERNENTLEYKSPKFADGFNVLAAISMNSGKENSKTADDSGKDDSKAYDLALTYKKDRIDFAAAYQNFGKNSANTAAPTEETDSERDAFRIAGSYQFTESLNLGALYQKAQFEDTDRGLDAQVWGVSGEYKFTPKTLLRTEYFYRDVDREDANTSLIALGMEHKLDPALRLYGNVATTLNDKNANLTPWKEGRSLGNGVSGSAGQDALALSLGMRYDF